MTLWQGQPQGVASAQERSQKRQKLLHRGCATAGRHAGSANVLADLACQQLVHEPGDRAANSSYLLEDVGAFTSGLERRMNGG